MLQLQVLFAPICYQAVQYNWCRRCTNQCNAVPAAAPAQCFLCISLCAATRLRDAADWSYPGSTLTTPTTQQAAAG
jgi:hypothetical protein